MHQVTQTSLSSGLYGSHGENMRQHAVKQKKMSHGKW
jgi:hypothetical protein